MPACTANYLMQKIAPCARSFFEAVKILRRMLHILDLRGFIEMLRTQTDYAKEFRFAKSLGVNQIKTKRQPLWHKVWRHFLFFLL